MQRSFVHTMTLVGPPDTACHQRSHQTGAGGTATKPRNLREYVGSACDNDALSELVGLCAHSVATALSALRSRSNRAKATSVFTALRLADIRHGTISYISNQLNRPGFSTGICSESMDNHYTGRQCNNEETLLWRSCTIWQLAWICPPESKSKNNFDRASSSLAG